MKSLVRIAALLVGAGVTAAALAATGGGFTSRPVFQSATVTGALATGTLSSGATTVTAGGIAVTGNSSVAGTLSSGAHTVTSGGIAVTGNSTIAGTLTATTPAVGDSSTNVATTAYVDPARSHAANGYQKMGSGLILQWGTAGPITGGSNAGTAVTFPLACPTAVYSVTISPINGSGNMLTTYTDTAYVASVTLSGFTAQLGGTLNMSVYWQAICK